MPKNSKETPVAMTVSTPEDQALAPIPQDLIQHSGEGTKGLGKNDVRPPRLMLAQAMSPQVKRGDAKQIDGLREGNLFNDLTGENYQDGPVEFVVVTFLGVRHIQFAPISEGGGIIDGNVPAGDPRTLFTTNDKGERERPIATKFYDYLIWLTKQNELMTLSMKGTAIKVAIKLNSLIKLPLKLPGTGTVLMSPPACARTFTLSSAPDKKDAYSWSTFKLETVGITPLEIRQSCYDIQASMEGINIVIEREPGSDEDEIPDLS